MACTGVPAPKKADVNTQREKSLHPSLLLGGIAAILLCGIATSTLMLHSSEADTIATAAEEQKENLNSGIHSGRSCPECGVIQSAREIEVPGAAAGTLTPPRGYEITVRLQDGSTQVITDPNPARWKSGERVSIIAGSRE